jgi:hypothetical protein
VRDSWACIRFVTESPSGAEDRLSRGSTVSPLTRDNAGLR